MKNIFEQAMASVTSSTIEYFFSGGQWRGKEYWLVSPLRSDDTHDTNFSISSNGFYFDLATGDKGNLIMLLSMVQGISRLEAAKAILSSSGKEIPAEKRPTKRTKPKEDDSLFYVPIPKAKRDIFKKLVKNKLDKYTINTQFKCTATYPYYNEKNELLFILVRLEKDKEKRIMPLSMKRQGKSDEVIWKNPIEANRPLYHLRQIVERPDLPVLLVEGEKCADIPVAGYVVATWIGGVNGIKKSDFSILQQRNVIIWCDNDEVGYQAGQAIKSILPHAQVMRKVTNKPKGWDLADAVTEDSTFDVHAFITEQIKQLPVAIHSNRAPACNFIPLGYQDQEWVFYLRRTKRLYYLKNTGITGQHLLQLEDLAWWDDHDFISERGSFRLTHVINYLKTDIEAQGIFDYPANMGMGFYRYEEDFLWHTGSELFNTAGERFPLEAFLPKKIFIAEKSTSHPFYPYSEAPISPSNHYIIAQYFYARSWAFDKGNFSAKIALGWALWSPFCGFFSWRPHLHLTAAAGTGKSTFIDYCISPLVAPYALRYNNLTTSAAIRQAVNKKPRPVILEEFEASGKDGDRSNANIEAVYDLAKSASDDVSAKTMKGTPSVDSNGRQAPREFEMKISFLFVSIREAVQDAALSQRIINIELAKAPSLDARYLDLENQAIQILASEAKVILAHNFRNLPYLIEQSRALTKAFIALGMEHRQAQNYAPLLTFSHFFTHGKSLSVLTDAPYYCEMISQFHQHLSSEKQMSDAEKCLDKILQADIISENNERMSATKIIRTMLVVLKKNNGNTNNDIYQSHACHLGRLGLALLPNRAKKIKEEYNHLELAIHVNSEPIRHVLKNSSYASSYSSILKRHPHCVKQNWRSNNTNLRNVAGLNPHFIVLKLEPILPWNNEEEESNG
ncbi:hypothetical protein PVA45_08325 (plasmid) [Entomospira entomophila]|uniref:Toprim domain-containing protein n=1 Tax=Entomospira entomophila TaxID=2719988 RepID=A0A968KUJ3_9SPIO|nr:hypothetical protein [Entomospira entomophilus]NIZ41536.1 hypothetical protein [Entomospira entomophilus]WDI36436.1 hypothetical protein PVA45_08325 [Entomospira entomophilus]